MKNEATGRGLAVSDLNGSRRGKLKWRNDRQNERRKRMFPSQVNPVQKFLIEIMDLTPPSSSEDSAQMKKR